LTKIVVIQIVAGGFASIELSPRGNVRRQFLKRRFRFGRSVYIESTTFRHRRFRTGTSSIDPTYLAQRERIYEGSFPGPQRNHRGVDAAPGL
jgi:hypothetical protein